jgi:hypothetical protein
MVQPADCQRQRSIDAHRQLLLLRMRTRGTPCCRLIDVVSLPTDRTDCLAVDEVYGAVCRDDPSMAQRVWASTRRFVALAETTLGSVPARR